MLAYARRATSGCQSASCVGRSVSHQPRIPAKIAKIRTLPREPPNSPRTAAATTQKIAAALRTGAEAGKSKYMAPAALTALSVYDWFHAGRPFPSRLQRNATALAPLLTSNTQFRYPSVSGGAFVCAACEGQVSAIIQL